MPLAVSIVKVIRGRVIEIHRYFYQSQPEDARVKVDVRLGLARDGRYMMKSFDSGNACLRFIAPELSASSGVNGEEAAATQFSRSNLIDIAPDPIFARFNGAHQRMLSAMELRGMFVLR